MSPKDAPSTEVAIPGGSDVVAALLDGKNMPVVENDEDGGRVIAEQILQANDLDQILGIFESHPWRNLLNVPVKVHGAIFRPSTFKSDGPPIFAVVDLTRLDTGERLTVTNSGRSIMTALYRMAQLDLFPADVELTEATTAKAGQSAPLNLKRAVANPLLELDADEIEDAETTPVS